MYGKAKTVAREKKEPESPQRVKKRELKASFVREITAAEQEAESVNLDLREVKTPGELP